MTRSAVGALLVTAAVGALVGATAFVGPPETVVEEHPEQVEPVVRTTSVCPYVGGEPRASSRVGVLAMTGVDEPDQPSGEPVAMHRLAGLDDEPDSFLEVSERGVPSSRSVEGGSPAAFAVRAEGALAPGVAAEQYMRANGPDLRGLVTAACTAPEREHWFVGASTEAGQRGRLVLSNPSDTAALVSVSFWDEAGPVEAAGSKDISVPARSQEVLVLDAFVAEAGQLGVRVKASQGRVAAALDFRASEDGEPRGITMIPVAAPPATSVVVPGVPGHGRRSLRILAPGETDAIVSVRVFGVDGPFSPLDHSVVTVPAGSVVEVPLGDILDDSPAAIALESDEEVTAAVRVVWTRSDELPDLGYTAAALPLPTAPAAAVLSRDSSGLSSRLLLTAVGEMGGRVTLTTLDGEGDVADEQTVEIPAGTTVQVDLESADDTSWAYTVVRAAAAGTVMAVRETRGSDDDGRLLDLMPLVAPAATVQVPEVVGELPTNLVPLDPSAR